MRKPPTRHSGLAALGLAAALTGLVLAGGGRLAEGHIVPPEELHPAVESYRRLAFHLRLNPVRWDQVAVEARTLAAEVAAVDKDAAEAYRQGAERLLGGFGGSLDSESGAAAPAAPPAPEERRAAATELFERSTRAVHALLHRHMVRAREALDDHPRAAAELDQARQVWAAFEHEIRAADPPAFQWLGGCWLELADALGSPGIYGVGAVPPDHETFREESDEILGYLDQSYGAEFRVAGPGRFVPLPLHSPTWDPARPVPERLPPGADLNKQLPRPRQILNMANRGAHESETALIALGDMAFDSPFIFGEPARSLALSCNTCHNKSITNPGLFIPGLSERGGGLDVSNAFFAPHASNGLFDPVDIPDLRGIRFTSPYGRNGRFDSLREFARNVIVNEFNGAEPDPMLLDGIVAYMLEFDFLPNPLLGPDGRLVAEAPEAARRGERLFHRPFEQMGNRSCATCHVPSDQFLDRKRHDVGTVAGAEAASRDRALDTPTLLSAAYTAPYFHDGSQPTLGSVVEWFDERYGLGLSDAELADLTAYLEAVGSGVDAYEDTVHTLEAEMEEFSFFLSTYETLRGRGKSKLIDTTFRTIALEIRAHKWDVHDAAYLPVLDRLAELMDEASAAERAGDGARVDAKVAEYRTLYGENAEHLR